MLKIVHALFAAALIAGGCGGGGPSITTACSDVANARCNRLSACTNGAFLTRSYGDLATCIAREALTCTIGLGAPQSGNSPAAVEQCVTAVASESCADLLGNNPPPECISKGPRAIGATCVVGGQCGSTYCINSKTSLCGICGDAPPSGISCVSTNCARQQLCTARTATCQKVAQLGDSCDNVARVCGADLACIIPTGETTSTCTASIDTLGADCGGTLGGCDGTKGLTCTAKKCVAIAYAGDGVPCGNFTGGGFGSCGAGGECYTSTGIAQLGEMGICKKAAADGLPCDTTLGPPCLAPARCVLTAGGSTGICTVADGKVCG